MLGSVKLIVVKQSELSGSFEPWGKVREIGRWRSRGSWRDTADHILRIPGIIAEIAYENGDEVGPEEIQKVQQEVTEAYVGFLESVLAKHNISLKQITLGKAPDRRSPPQRQGAKRAKRRRARQRYL